MEDIFRSIKLLARGLQRISECELNSTEFSFASESISKDWIPRKFIFAKISSIKICNLASSKQIWEVDLLESFSFYFMFFFRRVFTCFSRMANVPAD